MDYSRLIPDKAPADLYNCLAKEDERFRMAVLTYKATDRAYAEALTHCENFGGDYRRDTKARPALLWCSECEQESIAEWIPAKACHGCGNPSGIYIQDDYQQTSGEFTDGSRMRCPRCGAEGKIHSATAMNHGWTDQGFIVVPTVAEGRVVFTEWCLERFIYKNCASFTASPWQAYIVDGKKVVKLVHYRRGLGGGYYNLGKWEQLSRSIDTMGLPYMYPDCPDLEGTSLENAKLWEYKAQAYEAGVFMPIVYSRVYLKHNNAENLITSGLGVFFGEMLKDESAAVTGYYGRYEYKTPALAGIRWKKKKPNEMLGLTKAELRTVKKEGWGVKQWKCYDEHRSAITLDDAVEAMKAVDIWELKEILSQPINNGQVMRVIRYIKKQRTSFREYTDYLRMAVVAGLNLEDQEIRWPPHLRAAHDRLAAAAKYKTSEDKRRRFAEMSERCAALTWERDGICIRPAATPEELVAEGKTLHHCVGGYSDSHVNGKIILFIRHTRRPERSWYTLNVDVIQKRIIQNHGYGNERSPSGKTLRIRPEVVEFVAAWEREKLQPFQLPPAKIVEQTNKKNTKPTRRQKGSAVAEQ